MIEPARLRLSISAQCRLLRISRSSYYYAPVPETDETLALMTVIDATFLDYPWFGSRQLAQHLRRNGGDIGRLRARRLMGKMGQTPIYQRPRTGDPHSGLAGRNPVGANRRIGPSDHRVHTPQNLMIEEAA